MCVVCAHACVCVHGNTTPLTSLWVDQSGDSCQFREPSAVVLPENELTLNATKDLGERGG